MGQPVSVISFIESGGDIVGAMPVGVLPDKYIDKIGAKTNIIQLSSDTLQKNLAHHPEITTQDYLNLQTVIENASVIVQDSENTLIFVEKRGDRFYHTVIKATQTGEGVFMTSLRRTRESYVERIKSAGKVLKK